MFVAIYHVNIFCFPIEEWCSSCKMPFTTKKSLKRHNQTIKHKQQLGEMVAKPFICPKCGQPFTRYVNNGIKIIFFLDNTATSKTIHYELTLNNTINHLKKTHDKNNKEHTVITIAPYLE